MTNNLVLIQQAAAPVRGGDETKVAEVTEMKNSERLNDSKRKLTAVCSHQTRIGNLDAHLI